MLFNSLVEKFLEPSFERQCDVVIVSGLHGDEPAGNEASRYFKGVPGVEVIRNINTTGKRRDGRVDLNRQFGKNNKKANSILEFIKNKNPKIVISLHEDFDGEGVYVYCSKNLGKFLQDLLPTLNVPLVDRAYGDKAINGVITDCKAPWHNTLEQSLEEFSISYCTIETPTIWNFNTRVSLHITITQAIIQKLLKN